MKNSGTVKAGFSNSHRAGIGIRYLGFLLLSGFIISFLTLLGSCKDDDSPPPPSEIIDLLAKTWDIGSNGSVIEDGLNVSDQFSNFIITFNKDFTYSSTGGGPK